MTEDGLNDLDDGHATDSEAEFQGDQAVEEQGEGELRDQDEEADSLAQDSLEPEQERLVSLAPEEIRTSGHNRDERAIAPEDPVFAEFVGDIRARGGNIEPVRVRHAPRSEDDPAPWQLISGHRRLEACRQCGLKVLAIIAGSEPSPSLDRLRENIHRQDLSCYELAMQLQDLYDTGIAQDGQDLANKLNFSKSKISRIWRLIDLPDEFWELFEDRRWVPSGPALQVRQEWKDNPEGLREYVQQLLDQEQTATTRKDVRPVLDLVLDSSKQPGDSTKKHSLSGQQGDERLQVRRGNRQVQLTLPSDIWSEDLEKRLVEWLQSQPEAQQPLQRDADAGNGDDEPSSEEERQD